MIFSIRIAINHNPVDTLFVFGSGKPLVAHRDLRAPCFLDDLSNVVPRVLVIFAVLVVVDLWSVVATQPDSLPDVIITVGL